MDNVIMENKVLNLDKSRWVFTKLGDLAKDISKRVDNPAESEYDRFVGLGNFVSGDIKIKTWETTENLASSAKAFQAGDILFARRNAYLRRASLVDFDGCCSGDAFVLRENHEKVVPGFLAFFMNSISLWDYANSNAAGTMSKRVKWRDLANYEFLLPPKDQQAQLAELLWAMDEVIEKELSLQKNLEVSLNSFIKKIFTEEIQAGSQKETIRCKSLFQTQWENRSFPVGWKVLKLSEILKNTQNGFAEGKRDENGIPQLRMNNVTRDGRIDLEKVAMIPNRNGLERYLINENDVLFCNTNSEDLVGKSILATSEISTFCFSNHFTRLRGKEGFITQKFLYLWLKFHFDIGLFERLCTRWIGQAAVQTESLVRLQIIVPPLRDQEYAGDYCQTIEDNIDVVKRKIDHSQSLQKSLINQIFG
jgi:type I restriction enzyme S subunit